MAEKARIREKCYAEVRGVVRYEVTEFYRRHPEYAGDMRSKQGIEVCLKMLEGVLKVLDQYDINEMR